MALNIDCNATKKADHEDHFVSRKPSTFKEKIHFGRGRGRGTVYVSAPEETLIGPGRGTVYVSAPEETLIGPGRGRGTVYVSAPEETLIGPGRGRGTVYVSAPAETPIGLGRERGEVGVTRASTKFHQEYTDNSTPKHNNSSITPYSSNSSNSSTSSNSSNSSKNIVNFQAAPIVNFKKYLDSRIERLIRETQGEPEGAKDTFDRLERLCKGIKSIRDTELSGPLKQFLEHSEQPQQGKQTRKQTLIKTNVVTNAKEVYICEQLGETYASYLDDFIKYCHKSIDQYRGRDISLVTSIVLQQTELMFRNETIKEKYESKLQWLLYSFIEHEFEYAHFVLQFITTGQVGIIKSLRNSIVTLAWKLKYDKASCAIFNLIDEKRLQNYQRQYWELTYLFNDCETRPNTYPKLSPNITKAIKENNFDELKRLCCYKEADKRCLQVMIDEQLMYQLQDFYTERDQSRTFHQSFALLQSLQQFHGLHKQSVSQFAVKCHKSLFTIISNSTCSIFIELENIGIALEPRTKRKLEKVLTQLNNEKLLNDRALQAWNAYQHAPNSLVPVNAGLFNDKDARALIDSFFTAYDNFALIDTCINKLCEINSKLEKIETLRGAHTHLKRIAHANKLIYDLTFGRFFKFVGKNGLNTDPDHQYTQLASALEQFKGDIVKYRSITFLLKKEQVNPWERSACKAWINSLTKLQGLKPVRLEHLEDLRGLQQVAPTVPCKKTWQCLANAVQHVFFAYNSFYILGGDEKTISDELAELYTWANKNIVCYKEAATEADLDRISKLVEQLFKYEGKIKYKVKRKKVALDASTHNGSVPKELPTAHLKVNESTTTDPNPQKTKNEITTTGLAPRNTTKREECKVSTTNPQPQNTRTEECKAPTAPTPQLSSTHQNVVPTRQDKALVKQNTQSKEHFVLSETQVATQAISHAMRSLHQHYQHYQQNYFELEYTNFKIGVVEVNIDGKIIPISFTAQQSSSGVLLSGSILAPTKKTLHYYNQMEQHVYMAIFPIFTGAIRQFYQGEFQSSMHSLAQGKQALYGAIKEYLDNFTTMYERKDTETHTSLLNFRQVLKHFELPNITESDIDSVFDDLISSQLRVGNLPAVYLLYQIKAVILKTKSSLGFSYYTS